MDFELTEEQKMIRKTARELAIKKIAPISAEIDKTGQVPKDVIKTIADVGLFGSLIPITFGGAGGERIDYLLALEEIAAASASVAWNIATSTDAAFIILTFGSDEQKRKYLTSLAKGEKLGSFALSEPSGGTNWQQTMQTKAVAEGKQYILNGSKCFNSNAGDADIYIIFARTDMTNEPTGISALIVEKDTPGFSFGKREDKFGLRGDPTGELFFEDCRVPRENLLGQEGDGLKIFLAFGALNCLSQATVFVGIAQAALDATIKYTKERTVVEPITLANFESVQSTIADMVTSIEAARLLTYRAGTLGGNVLDPSTLMAPIFSSEIAMSVTDKAIRLHGGYGCTSEFPVGRYFRDAKTLSLQKSADHVKLMAGKMLLDIPLGPPPKISVPPKTIAVRKI
ncbi:MAG: acyl-CoA dehydrogenase family protein [Candidatus Thorarchaeota archaeon]